MKKIILFCLSLFVFGINTSHAQAADNDDTEHANESSKGEKIKTLLGLSDEQTVKFREVVLERRAAIKAVKEDAALSADAKDSKLKEIDAKRAEKFKTIFTPEQFTKWSDYVAAKKKN